MMGECGWPLAATPQRIHAVRMCVAGCPAVMQRANDRAK